MFLPNDLILIRHGVTQSPDRLCGRTDVALNEVQPDTLAALQQALAGIEHIITSPAQRCVQTADLIWGQGTRASDDRLWEQDFGAWESQLYTDLPDIGTLDQSALARHQPPEGESFLDLCTRVKPVFDEAAQKTESPSALVVHAGVIRAALGLALEAPAKGLRFDVAHLSVTHLRCLPAGGFSIIATNWRAR